MTQSFLETSRLQDAAEELTTLPVTEQVKLLAARPPRAAAAVMPDGPLGALLNAMAPDDRTRLLGALPDAECDRLIALLNAEERSEAEMLLQFPENSVGRLMTPHYIAVHEGWTIREVLDYVRAHGENSDTLNVIYVIDDRGVLIDDIRIRELLVVPVDKRMADIMDRKFVVLHATDEQASAVDTFRREDRSALPVVDANG